MPEETREQKKARMARAGAWLYQERWEKRRMSQATLAQLAGLPSQNRISNYENGVYDIKPEVAADLARALGLSEYDTWLGLGLRLPAEVATREKTFRWALAEITPKQAEALYERVAELRTRARGRRRDRGQGGSGDRPNRVTRSGRNPQHASRDEESAI